jgi:carotenoid cleavage dioxygenase
METPERPNELPFYLQGNFAPVSEEVTARDLPVEGALPRELCGRYLRNGPNPRGGDPGHWFMGDGMVHGVRLENGKARWYRNRWVRTRAFEEGAQLVGADGRVDHSVAVANTNVIGHAGRIFALVESSFPTELTPELDTLGVCDFEGRLTTSMTTHPKLCPITRELHFFGYRFFPPYLTYHRLDADGKLDRSLEIAVPGPTMMHDFAITEHHVIFMDLPIVFTPERVGKGFPYQWSDDYGARLGVMKRGAEDADVRWLDISPCYIFHPMNAYEDGDRIVLDVARYASLWREGPDHFDPATLHRFTLDLAVDTVRETALDDRPIEFPRVDDRRGGVRHRYGYAVKNAANVGEAASTLVRYDLATGASEEHDFGPGCAPGEGVFVPASERAAEDEGFVIQLVYDASRNIRPRPPASAARYAGPEASRSSAPSAAGCAHSAAPR